MPSDTLRIDVSEGVALLTFNRPEVMNALNRELFGALTEALTQVRDDDAIRVAVLTGTGRAFSAGIDIKERAETGAGAGGLGGGGVHEFFPAAPGASPYTFDPGKPVIAAVNGFCLGGGMEIALACDLRIAGESARFGQPDVTRGFFPGGGAAVRLPRVIPRAFAMDMLLTGEPIDAATALRWGLVSRVVADDELLPSAMGLARKMAGYGPVAMRALREVVRAQEDLPLAQALRFSSSLRWIVGKTDDAEEGLRAFAERRDPEFTGR